MTNKEFLLALEQKPVIAAIRDENWQQAIASPVEIIFYLKANLFTVQQRIAEATRAGKAVFVHIDLAEGIGKDRIGITFLQKCGVAGIISTRQQLIHLAKEKDLLAVQRFFALDSQGLGTIDDICKTSQADVIEVMPGVIPKVIQKFALNGMPVIAGGLIDEPKEVAVALQNGAAAVSTGKIELWK